MLKEYWPVAEELSRQLDEAEPPGESTKSDELQVAVRPVKGETL
jgi:hypothetical protein